MPHKLVNNTSVETIVLGQITRDFIIPTKGKAVSDIPGGSALYFAAGAAVWKKGRIGVVSQVGDDFPLSKLHFLENHDVDLVGIRVFPHTVDNRSFHSGITGQAENQVPNAHNISAGKELPRALLGYQNKSHALKSRRPESVSILPRVPESYMKSHLAHFCSSDPDSQIARTALLMGKYPGLISHYVSNIPPDRKAKDQLISSLGGQFCVVINKMALKELFNYDSEDYASIIKSVTQIKAEHLVVLLGEQGRLLVETRADRSWFIPLYPVQAINPTGKNHSFCGGFSAMIRENFNPLEAVLAGAVSSSLVAQGIGLQYPLDAPLYLLKSRFDRLRSLIQKI
jgi:sugar/nucleoside kinase (ribokinase family)